MLTCHLVLAPAVIPFVVPTFFVMRSAKSLMRPITNRNINDHAESFGRATVLSAAQMLCALFTIPFTLVGGVAAGIWEPVAAVIAMGPLFFAGALVSSLLDTPVKAVEPVVNRAD